MSLTFWESDVRPGSCFRRLLRCVLPLLLLSQAPLLSTASLESRVCDFFAELWRYAYTGAAFSDGVEEFRGIGRASAEMMARAHWSEDGRPGRLIDLLLPEYSGIFDADAAYGRPSVIESIPQEMEEFDAAGGFEIGRQFGGFADAPRSEEESPCERSLRNSQRMLRLYSYGDEFLYVQKDGGGRVVARTDGSQGLRTYFDGKMRMVRRERWSISGGMEATLAAEEQYRYGDSSVPVSAVIVEGGERRVLRYNDDGRPSECKIYVPAEYVPADVLPAGVSKDGRALGGITRWKYTASGRLCEMYQEEYRYKDGRFSRPSSVSSIREVYEYKVEGGAPDRYYYEDGEIRTQTVYSSADSYVTTVYFDGGFSAESYYTGGRHIKDCFYIDGALLRRRLYE